MRRIITIMCLFLILSSCSTNKEKTFSIEKKGDYIYEVDYTYDYSIDSDHESFKKYNIKPGACSSIQIGSLRGRTFDWYLDDNPIFVIHTDRNDKRYASVGITQLIRDVITVTDEDISKGLSQEVINELPFFITDGINEEGLTINENMVPFMGKGTWTLKTPNNEEDDRSELLITRMLLDKASTIEECIEILNSYDWYSTGTYAEMQFMITGKRSKSDPTITTVIVELLPISEGSYRAPYVISNNKDDEALVNKDQFYLINDSYLTMTNFHLYGYDGTDNSLEDLSWGIERYELLKENANKVNSIDSMFELMRLVNYSNRYNLNMNKFWYTDYYDYNNGLNKNTPKGKDNLNGDPSNSGEYFKEIIEFETNAYKNKELNIGLWHSVFTSVIDTNNKKLYISPRETDKYYEFNIK